MTDDNKFRSEGQSSYRKIYQERTGRDVPNAFHAHFRLNRVKRVMLEWLIFRDYLLGDIPEYLITKKY